MEDRFDNDPQSAASPNGNQTPNDVVQSNNSSSYDNNNQGSDTQGSYNNSQGSYTQGSYDNNSQGSYTQGSYNNSQGSYTQGSYNNSQGSYTQGSYDYNAPNNYQQPYQNNQTGEKDGVATAILVLGILSIICCAPCGIVSLVLRSNNKDLISPEKQSMVQAGYITSIIGLCIWGVGILANIVATFFGITVGLFS